MIPFKASMRGHICGFQIWEIGLILRDFLSDSWDENN